jgi:hypothetical protein
MATSRLAERLRRMGTQTRGSKRYGLGIASIIVLLICLGLSQRRDPAFLRLSPIMPTSAKALLLARSTDGLNFVVEREILGRAMASQAHYYDLDSTLSIVATDPTVLRTRRGPNGRTVKRTSTLVWRIPDSDKMGLLRVDGCTSRGRGHGPHCVDPTIVEMPGGQLRMFWVRSGHRVDPAFSTTKNEFLSALSDGAGGWTLDPGVRFLGVAAADPDVIRLPDGRWRMYFSRGLVLDEEHNNSAPAVMSAISTDGLHFVVEPGVRKHRCSASASMVLASGQIRMYCHRRKVFWETDTDADPSAYIISSISDDGLKFEQEPGVRIGPKPVRFSRMIGAAAPSLRFDPDGGITMMFTTVVEPPYPFNRRYLVQQAKVFDHIQIDLGDRAKMGPPDSGGPGDVGAPGPAL